MPGNATATHGLLSALLPLPIFLLHASPPHPAVGAEISFMPEALASRDTHIMHYNGNTSPPKDYNVWYAFIREMFTLIVARYGAEEVRTWRVEVWNEPCDSCGGFWSGSQADYFTLYNYTARAVKSVDALIPVGGPASYYLGWITDGSFLGYVRNHSVPLDFLSSHLYPDDSVVPFARDGFEGMVNDTANFAAAHGLPLLITEFSAGLNNNAYDAPYAASFLAHVAAAFQDVPNVPLLSFWTFTGEGARAPLPGRRWCYDRVTIELGRGCTLKYGRATHFGFSSPTLHSLLGRASRLSVCACRRLRGARLPVHPVQPGARSAATRVRTVCCS